MIYDQKDIKEIWKKRFNLEAEAQLIVNDLNNCERRGTFCPLIKGQCWTNCECFIPASVGQRVYSYGKGKQFTVEGFYCDNAMFSESRQVYN